MHLKMLLNPYKFLIIIYLIKFNLDNLFNINILFFKFQLEFIKNIAVSKLIST